jgi:DNA-binding MarR family transcriptional regulator
MDADLAGIYDERGLGDVRPRFVMPLIRLAHRGPLTIRALATSLAVSHSAMSQTVTALRRAGYVDSAAGTDARTREITLTAKGRALVPFLEDEWRATEAAVADIEAEVPYPLSQVVTDLAAALATRSFHDRVSERLGQTAHV